MSELLPPEAREQALEPVANGRLLRTSVGVPMWKLVPPPARTLAWALVATPAAALMVGLLGPVANGHDLKTSLLYWLVAIGGGAVLFRARALLRWCTRVANARLRRAALHVTAGSLRGSPAGSLVRVMGTVLAPEPFVSAVMGKPAVLAVYEGTPAYHQVRGIDFMLEVDGGEAVRVAVQDAYFDEAAREESAAVARFRVVGNEAGFFWREARIGPGDRVEAIGVLVREVDPTLAAGPGRDPPLRCVIRARGRTPLLLRRV
jgi:hypothetical protein